MQTFSGFTLEDFLQQRVPAYSLYSVIAKIGKAHLLEAQAAIEQYLTHEDPKLRYIALMVLGLYWHLPEHQQTALDFITHDPDLENQSLGITIVSGAHEGSHDRPLLTMLAHIVRNDQQSAFLRQSAYVGMLRLRDVDRRTWFRTSVTPDFNPERDVDWAMVDTYLDTSDGSPPDE